MSPTVMRIRNLRLSEGSLTWSFGMNGKNSKKKTLKSASSKLEYGTVDVDLSDLKPHEVKIRISTMIDKDILLQLKTLAKERKTKYQTLLNMILRSFVEMQFVQNKKKVEQPLEETVRRIVKEELRKRA